jgi:hypothetical protein
MPLSKIEELTDTFINRGYLKPARSLLQRSEFCEWSELFIMTALYRLGTGVSFQTCCALCNISTSEVYLFFDTFLHVMHEMQEEYILMPTNITHLRRITNFTRKLDCLAVADRWMWFMSNGHHVQLAIIIVPRVRGAIPVLCFSVLPISIVRFWPSTVHNLVQDDKEIVKDDPNVPYVQTGW